MLSLKRVAWSPRVVPNAAVVSGQQPSDPRHLSHLHADLRLQLPVLFSVAAGLAALNVVTDISLHAPIPLFRLRVFPL